MLPSLMVFAFLANCFASIIQAVPLPQDGASINAPAGPPITDLSSTLGDLVIPQEEAPNDTAKPIAKIRSPPPTLDTLVNEIEDFRLPANITTRSLARVARSALPALSDDEMKDLINTLRPTSTRT